MADKTTLWLIPARGGSKGIPGKNLKAFCGLSLVARAILQAKECAGAGDIIHVSTDSKEIKEEAENIGVYVPFMRPAPLATDTASTYSVILHTLEEYKKKGENIEKVVLLQPTSPLRKKEDIEGALKLWQPDFDMVVSVCEAKANPYFNAFEEDNMGYLKISKGEGKYTRRQDAPSVWEYNGAVYVITTESLLAGPISSFSKIKGFEMPSSRSVDLDTPEDWMLAEYLWKEMNKKQN